MVVRGKFVPVEDSELNLECCFVLTNMEEKFLIPDRVKWMSDNACTEYLLAEWNDNEWIHIPASSGH